jgi:DNA-directed RNA polymerase specialized sigma24 family protein
MPASMTSQPRDLSDPALARAVCAVLRLNGVPADDVEDLLQDTRLEAQKAQARLPMSEPDRTNYVCGIARHLARKWRVANKAREHREGIVPWALRPKTPPYEERDLAAKLHEFAVARDPVGTDWLLRAKVYGENEVAIAEEDGVPADRVRKRVSRMLVFLRDRAMTLVAAVALLVAGVWEMARQPAHIAKVPEIPEVVPAPLDAAALRSRARAACDARAWKECVDDLDAARSLDPAGETRETRVLRALAEEQLRPHKAPIPVEKPTDDKATY